MLVLVTWKLHSLSALPTTTAAPPKDAVLLSSTEPAITTLSTCSSEMAPPDEACRGKAKTRQQAFDKHILLVLTYIKGMAGMFPMHAELPLAMYSLDRTTQHSSSRPWQCSSKVCQ
jgi:hypothetical protein